MYQRGTGSTWCFTFDDNGAHGGSVLGASWMCDHNVIFDKVKSRLGTVYKKIWVYLLLSHYVSRQKYGLFTESMKMRYFLKLFLGFIAARCPMFTSRPSVPGKNDIVGINQYLFW